MPLDVQEYGENFLLRLKIRKTLFWYNTKGKQYCLYKKKTQHLKLSENYISGSLIKDSLTFKKAKSVMHTEEQALMSECN